MDTVFKREPFDVGASVSFTKIVTREDIETFAELSGDFSPNHVDDDFMKSSKYGRIIAHGALLVAYMSRASSMIIEAYGHPVDDCTPVSLGYDKIRFIKPVFVDDNISIKYTVVQYERITLRSNATIEIYNAKEELVAVASHILKWVPNQ